LSTEASLGKIDNAVRPQRRLTVVRWLLPVGWALAAIGFYGPWVAQPTAALTLSGVDMGEFVKFLPGLLDGSLSTVRQLFYLPPFACAVSVALLVGSRRLRFSWAVRVPALLLAVPVSLQLLPPAWSPSSLMTPEFRLQTVALGLCWLLLASFWLLGSLPPWLAGSLSALLCLMAMVMPAWQFLVVKPAIDDVYRLRPPVGWGFVLCLAGLGIMAVGSFLLVLRTRTRSRSPWSGK
jgi:hypothetical protein